MKQTQTSPHRPLSLTISLVSLVSLFSLLVSACGSSTTSFPLSTPTLKGGGTVQVMYAASLESIMENRIAPAFKASTDYTFEGEAKGSLALANEIKGHLHRPDIFISAAPVVNKELMGTTNGNYVSWYMNFARSEMVIGYNPQSHFSTDFQAVAHGSKLWYQVLEEPGLHLGRTDPLLDPKGQATLYLCQLAEHYYNQSGLDQKILGADENVSQIFPEEELVARLGTGQLDAGFFYINEAKAAHIPFLTLPDQINLGNPSLAATYTTAQWTNPQTKQMSKGSPIVFTITIPRTSQDMAGSVAFATFLLSPQGQSILLKNGLLSTPFTISGTAKDVPQSLQIFIQSEGDR